MSVSNRHPKGSREGGRFAPAKTPDEKSVTDMQLSGTIHDTKFGGQILCISGEHDEYDYYDWCEKCGAETWIGIACDRCTWMEISDTVCFSCSYDEPEDDEGN